MGQKVSPTGLRVGIIRDILKLRYFIGSKQIGIVNYICGANAYGKEDHKEY